MAERRSLKELAEDPRFIPGVYNYCDRWCERCPLTSRCLVYATEREDGAAEASASGDIRNQAFWTRLEKTLREAQEMLQELLEEHGIEVDPADAVEAWARARRRHDEARSHPSVAAAEAYRKAADRWFEQAEACLAAHGEALKHQERMELSGADPGGVARRLREAVEVIRWYQPQIVIKLMRAAASARQEAGQEEPLDRSDADGSAKVALIGTDRSLAAWAELLRQLPEEEDRILPLLVALDRMRREVEACFPKAWAFIRPGFDVEVWAGEPEPESGARPSA